jgi:NitT/TauT family transport system permease protein
MTVGVRERPVMAAPSRGRSWLARQLRDRERVLLGAVTVVVLLALWEVLTRTGVANAAFVSSPSRIAVSLAEYLGPGGTGWGDLAASGQEFAYGFLISVALGVPVGILMGWYHRRLDALLNPIVLFLNTSPRIATAPLFVIWFGLGLESKVWVVVLSAIVPIIVNARAGVVTIEPSLIAMSRSYGNSDLRVLPGTVPAISSGLRLGIGHALLGVVLAEFISSTQGLGYVVVSSAATFNTDRLFVAVLLIAFLGMLVTGLLGRVEKYFDRWRTA